MYVLLDCKLSFRCFDGVAVLSANCRCGIKPARSTKNFGMDIVHSGNRRKFTSMFNCASLARPCASVGYCCMKFQVRLTILIMHPYFGERYRYLVKHWKDCFYHRKKKCILEMRCFASDLPFHRLHLKFHFFHFVCIKNQDKCCLNKQH